MMVKLLARRGLVISVHCIVRIYDWNILDDCDLFKCYVVLYTCTSTRGAILEFVPDAKYLYQNILFGALESLYHAEVVQER